MHARQAASYHERLCPQCDRQAAALWVLRLACRQAQTWQQQIPGAESLWVSVNLSAKQLAQPNVVAFICDILEATGLAPHNLKEGTETIQQADELPRLACDFSQGWLFSKALAAVDLEAMMTAQQN